MFIFDAQKNCIASIIPCRSSKIPDFAQIFSIAAQKIPIFLKFFRLFLRPPVGTAMLLRNSVRHHHFYLSPDSQDNELVSTRQKSFGCSTLGSRFVLQLKLCSYLLYPHQGCELEFELELKKYLIKLKFIK